MNPSTEVADPKVAAFHKASPQGALRLPFEITAEGSSAGVEHFHKAAAGTMDVIYPFVACFA